MAPKVLKKIVTKIKSKLPHRDKRSRAPSPALSPTENHTPASLSAHANRASNPTFTSRSNDATPTLSTPPPASVPSPSSSVHESASHDDAVLSSYTQAFPEIVVTKAPSASELWCRAYAQAKQNDFALVESYEDILEQELKNAQDEGTSSEHKPESGWQIMKAAVDIGLKKVDREIKIKRKFQGFSDILTNMKSLISTAVAAAPHAAVAWAGVSLVLQLLTNPITETVSNADGIKYVISRMEWYWNLAESLLAEHQVQDSLPSQNLDLSLENIIVDLYEALLIYQMKSLRLYYFHRGLVFAREFVLFDDWKTHLSNIQTLESSVNQYVSQRTNLKVQTLLRQIYESCNNKMNGGFDKFDTAIDRLLEAQKKTYDMKTVNNIFRSLRLTDPQMDMKRIVANNGGLVRGSSDWIFENAEFKCWMSGLSSRLLWIKGDPGKGKTMLVSSIIETLQQNHNSWKYTTKKSHYFFCQAPDAQLNNPVAVIRGLLFSLAREHNSLLDHVLQDYEVAGPSLFQDQNAWTVLSEKLISFLKDPLLDSQVLVIDALDECVQDMPVLLDLITLSLKETSVRWLVSSRNGYGVEKVLKRCNGLSTLSLEMNDKLISEAVQLFIQNRVQHLVQQKELTPKTQDYMEKYMLENAEGTFLWVSLVCKELNKLEVEESDIEDTMRQFPPGLYSLYDRMIDKIVNSHKKDQHLDLLRLATMAEEPLSLIETESILNIQLQPSEKESFVQSCGSFLTLKDGMVYFVHQSADDYLLDAKHGKMRLFEQGEDEGQFWLFVMITDNLRRTLKRNIYNLPSENIHIRDVVCPDPDPLIPVQYSMQNWAHHLSRFDHARNRATSSQVDILNSFMKDGYIFHLIEALCLTSSYEVKNNLFYRLPEIVSNLRHMELMSLSNKDYLFYQILYDMEDIVCGDFFENYPLQIYRIQDMISAQVFSSSQHVGRVEITLHRNISVFFHERIFPEQPLDHHKILHYVKPSHDGKLIATIDSDGFLRIWLVAQSRCLHELNVDEPYDDRGDSIKRHHLAFSSDNERLAYFSPSSSRVTIFNVSAGTICSTEYVVSNRIIMISFYDNGSLFILDEGKLHSLSCESSARSVLSSGNDSHSNIAWYAVSSDNSMIMVPVNNWVLIKDVTGITLGKFPSDQYLPRAIFVPNSNNIALVSKAGELKIVDIGSGKIILSKILFSPHIYGMNTSPCGRYIALHFDRHILVLDLMTKTLSGFSTEDLPCRSEFLNSYQAFYWGYQTRVRIYTIRGLRKAGNPWWAINELRVSPNGSQFLAWGSFQVDVYDTESCTWQFSITHGSKSTVGAAYQSDSKCIITYAQDGTTVKFWDSNGNFLYQKQTTDHEGGIISCSFSLDSSRLAVLHCAGTIDVLDSVEFTVIRKLYFDSPPLALDFSRSTNELQVLTQSDVLELWDTDTGVCIGILNELGNVLDIRNRTRKPCVHGLLHLVNLNWMLNPKSVVQSLISRDFISSEPHSKRTLCIMSHWGNSINLAGHDNELELFNTNSGVSVFLLNNKTVVIKL